MYGLVRCRRPEMASSVTGRVEQGLGAGLEMGRLRVHDLCYDEGIGMPVSSTTQKGNSNIFLRWSSGEIESEDMASVGCCSLG